MYVKHLAYYRELWVKAPHLLYQCISLWLLVFHYCISSMAHSANKPHKHAAFQKTVGECVFMKNRENATFIQGKRMYVKQTVIICLKCPENKVFKMSKIKSIIVFIL